MSIGPAKRHKKLYLDDPSIEVPPRTKYRWLAKQLASAGGFSYKL